MLLLVVEVVDQGPYHLHTPIHTGGNQARPAVPVALARVDAAGQEEGDDALVTFPAGNVEGAGGWVSGWVGGWVGGWVKEGRKAGGLFGRRTCCQSCLLPRTTRLGPAAIPRP